MRGGSFPPACQAARKPATESRSAAARSNSQAEVDLQVAVGETVILMTPPFIPIETPTKGRGGYSRMTVSPTATCRRQGGRRRGCSGRWRRRAARAGQSPPSATASGRRVRRSRRHAGGRRAAAGPHTAQHGSARCGGGAGRTQERARRGRVSSTLHTSGAAAAAPSARRSCSQCRHVQACTRGACCARPSRSGGPGHPAAPRPT